MYSEGEEVVDEVDDRTAGLVERGHNVVEVVGVELEERRKD